MSFEGNKIDLSYGGFRTEIENNVLRFNRVMGGLRGDKVYVRVL